MKLVVFEGTDGSGKSTLKSYIDKKTNYKYTCIDRMTGSTLVYDKETKRYDRESKIRVFEKRIKNCCVIVYCYASIKTLKERQKQKGDYIEIEKLNRHLTNYKHYLAHTPFSFIKINTDIDIEVCANQIIDFLEDEKCY